MDGNDYSKADKQNLHQNLNANELDKSENSKSNLDLMNEEMNSQINNDLQENIIDVAGKNSSEIEKNKSKLKIIENQSTDKSKKKITHIESEINASTNTNFEEKSAKHTEFSKSKSENATTGNSKIITGVYFLF